MTDWTPRGELDPIPDPSDTRVEPALRPRSFDEYAGQRGVKERLRVLVQRHELEPHEAAIPLAMSGRFLGNPKLSGLGAAVAH